MSSLVGGTGIIGQDMVCGFGKVKNWFDVSKNQKTYEIVNSKPSSIEIDLSNLIGKTFKSGVTFLAHFDNTDLTNVNNFGYFGIDINFIFEDGTNKWSNSTVSKFISLETGQFLHFEATKGYYIYYNSAINKKIVGFNVKHVFSRYTRGTIKVSNIAILEGDWRNKQIPKYLLKEVS